MPTKAKNTNLDSKKQKGKGGKKLSLAFINSVLATIFYILWILIGLFILLFIYANIKQGFIQNLFSASPPPQQAAQIPQETELPGVGTVNIECIQNSLSTETIQKLIEENGTSTLTDEENESLAPCIVKPEETPEDSGK